MMKTDFSINATADEPPLTSKRNKKDWKNWQWQITNSITDLSNLDENLDDDRINLPFRVTPYYLEVIKNNPELMRTVIPSAKELNSLGLKDPLCESNYSPVKNIIHKYPDRVLFLVTNFCSTNCRFCTRSRIFDNENLEIESNKWEEAIQYIENHSEIRDVLISGGDPLTLTDDKIDYLLSRIRSINHVEIIRIGTKIPVVLPQRITPSLVKILKKYHPLFLSIHFTHADEITKDCIRALNMLSNCGIPLGSQTVLLKDVNDNPETIKALMHKLLMNRVKPYYIYSCDHVSGTAHFWTDIEKGLEIINSLRGFTTGYAIPQFIVDSSEGKIAISPNNIIQKNENEIILRSFTNKEIAISIN